MRPSNKSSLNVTLDTSYNSGWNSILLTMHYHDIIYDISKNDNEEKSVI